MRNTPVLLSFAIVAAVAGVLPLTACTSRSGYHNTGSGNPSGTCPSGCSNCNMQGACNDCTPGSNACYMGNAVSCNADGTFGAAVKMCDTAGGEQCMGGDCVSACDAAAASHSYIGCDYYPTTTLTSQLNPYFDFAVAIANPLNVGDVTQSAPATVTITRNGQAVKTVTVNAGDVQTVILPWVAQVAQNPDCSGGTCMPVTETSGLTHGGAYHLVSTLPVTVYQFSPLQFEKPSTANCQDFGGADPTTCHSYSNDASILLPSTALDVEYIALSRQTFALDDGASTPIPGFVTIVGTQDGTNVMVQSSAYTEAGTGVTALTPGGTASYMLNAGDVLQLVSKRATSPCATTSSDANGYTYCDMGPKYDLTGTHITANNPIAVFGGHACTFTPYDKWACDHIEEQITPLNTWGQKIVVAQTKPHVQGEPNVWRVISGSDGNTITFDPPATYKGGSVTLDTGKWVEFIAQGGFQVTSTGRVAVGQYPVGENYVSMSVMVGDPDLGLGVPVEQYRLSYDFISPSTYTENNLTVIAQTGTNLMLDNAVVAFSPKAIGGSGYGYQYISLKPGAHHVTADQPFGITVSGVASFTSYLYVGGQNLMDVPLQ